MGLDVISKINGKDLLVNQLQHQFPSLQYKKIIAESLPLPSCSRQFFELLQRLFTPHAGPEEKLGWTRRKAMASDGGQAGLRPVWDHIDANFVGHHMFGVEGADQIGRLAARASAHPWPYGMALQTALLACSNGAAVAAWSIPSPLSLACMAVNPAQTRKSGTTAAMKEIGKVIDKTARARAGAGKQPNSCVLSVFTEAALFQRASADITAECPRTHFSTALAMDESYRFLQMLGLTPASHGKQSSLVPTNAASQFNELMQTGMTELACKTAGSYDSGGVSCNVCAVGNMHANCFLALARGQMGNHEAACMERLLFLCGRPVPAHAELPESLALPASFDRLTWVPLLINMLSSLGLTQDALHLETARKKFDALEDVSGCPCFRIVLADGCQCRLRFKTIAT